MDDILARAARNYANELMGISSNAFVQGGLVKAAVSEVIWALFDIFLDSRFALAEQLEGFDECGARPSN